MNTRNILASVVVVLLLACAGGEKKAGTAAGAGGETKLVIAGERQPPMVDPKLIEAIAQAHNWRDRLIGGISVADLARELGLDDGEIRKWYARVCGAGSPQPFEADYPEGFQVGQSRAAVLLGD